MDIESAKKRVLIDFPNATIKAIYKGYIGEEFIYAFALNGHFVMVYDDGTVRELTSPPLINSILSTFELCR